MKKLILVMLVGACYSQPQQQPTQGYPQQQGGYGQQQGWQGQQQGAAEYYCARLESSAARGSLCFAQWDRCEAERRAAESDGARTVACAPQSPVACFQLQGDPNPSMEMCAASIEDCDLWRHIDREKNGQTGNACEWRHAPGMPPR
jgi:hypothetical protein